MLIIKGSFNTQVVTALNLSTHYGKIYTFFLLNFTQKENHLHSLKGNNSYKNV